jgi:hypothetical protein
MRCQSAASSPFPLRLVPSRFEIFERREGNRVDHLGIRIPFTEALA